MQFTIAIASVILTTATAMAENCASITGNQDRLACYDRDANEKLSASLASGATGDQSRWNYRANLERAFLESGMSADVIMDNPKSTKLIVWTYLSKAAVYKLITEAKLLDGAKEAGFKTLDFWDKGNEGHWIYNLTKPSNCDVANRLCY